ncbi:MAG: putative toxin-antitoxin system toxin component, PIN family [Deltaproteobacteria bacterium]|nr:putative toxin-antitoxin system toxin component, PIN family [Deltaproteobacteria bacterium]
MRAVVLDTNVVVSGLRSQRGAAFRLLSLVGSGRFEHCMSVALAFEYADAVTRPGAGIRLRRPVIEDILDYLCASARKVKIHFLWRPTLADPKDDMVLEVAVCGGCEAIVTYNIRDFRGCGAFGVRAIRPQKFLSLIGADK